MKDFTIQFIVIGSGDPSVGIPATQETVVVNFYDQPESFLQDTNMIEELKEFLKDKMENCKTKVYTEREWEKHCECDCEVLSY